MDSILQWNCRGVRSKIEELKVLMNVSSAKIVCLQETKLGDEDLFLGHDYKFYKSVPPPGDRAKGGCGIIVKSDIHHDLLSLRTNLQAVALRVSLQREITICSIYIPPEEEISRQDVEDLIQELPSPFLLLGDFNSHNRLWFHECINTNRIGRIMEEILSIYDIQIFNDGSPTYHNIYTDTYSGIDLSLCSSELFLDYQWSVIKELHGSDHFPILMSTDVSSSPETLPKWKLELANWALFTANAVVKSKVSDFKTVQEAYDYLTKLILSSAEASIPKSKPSPTHMPVPWWNKACEISRKVQRAAYKRLKRNPTIINKIIHQRVSAKKRRTFKKAKKESWIRYVNGISSSTKPKKVWKKIRKLVGKYVGNPLPVLKQEGEKIRDPCSVANILAESFSSVSSVSQYSEEFRNIRSRANVEFPQDSSNSEYYNMPFTVKEMMEALADTSNTAPGEDDIVYEMLKHLSYESKIFLLELYNLIWRTSILPESWTKSIILAILKPGKDASSPTNYRPIALTSCLCKLLEKMINKRLVWFLETNNCISEFQFGFRKFKSTTDPLVRISTDIQNSFAKSQHTIAVFFDLQKAYDTTWRYGVLRQFYRMGIRGRLFNFLFSFLRNRSFKVRVGTKYSEEFVQEEGLPQGSVLSVTCFIVAINSICNVIPENVRSSLFVDDIAIYCSSSSPAEASGHLQIAVSRIVQWADERGFTFSSQKTVAIHFTRSRKRMTVPHLLMKGIPIPYEKEVKFLGMIFDSKLTWTPHLKFLRKKALKALNILKVISHYSWGSDRKTMLKLYDSLVRSKLDYGSQIYSSACKTSLQMLDPVHNLGIRLSTGAFKSSPVMSLYADSGELPLYLRREEIGLRYLFRLQASPNNPSKKIVFGKRNNIFERHPRLPKPFGERIKESISELNVDMKEVKEMGFSKTPPWLIPDIRVCEKWMITPKANTPPENTRMMFLEHDEKHKKWEKIYTDGSKSERGVGFAAVSKKFVYYASLPSYSSIFTAELHGILAALRMVNNLPQGNFVIYSDSQCVLSAIKKYAPSHPLIQEIQEWMMKLCCLKKKEVIFCWCPGHIGVKGNETADREAKLAVDTSIYKTKSVYHDFKISIKHHIKKKWLDIWKEQCNNKLFKIKQDVDVWTSSFHKHRRKEVVLARLRIGHTLLTHGYLMEKGNAPICSNCQQNMSIEHLFNCRGILDKRKKFGFTNSDGSAKHFKEILGKNVDIEKIFMFLKDLKVLDII